MIAVRGNAVVGWGVGLLVPIRSLRCWESRAGGRRRSRRLEEARDVSFAAILNGWSRRRRAFNMGLAVGVDVEVDVGLFHGLAA